MATDISPKSFSAAVGISESYSSQILNGKRPASSEIALAAFRAFGVRLGLLAEMTDADIARLSAQASEAAECHGGDASVTGFDHADPDSAPSSDLSTGQDGDLSRQLTGAAL